MSNGKSKAAGGKSELVQWVIPNFPRELRDKFVGLARSRGSTSKALLQELVQTVLNRHGTYGPRTSG
mgnify:CR=1 FL=1